MKKERLNKFLEEYPLYKEFIAVSDYEVDCEGYTNPTYLHGETFDYYCDIEKEMKTFELSIAESSINYWERFIEGEIPDCVYNENQEIDYIERFVGYCKSCKKFHVEFLLHIWSDKKIPKTEHQILTAVSSKTNCNSNGEKFNDAKIFIEKVGVYPSIKVNVDRILSKYFDRETNNWYYKALIAINKNLGIGAFAYFRRIIEKELIAIVNDLAKMNTGESFKIQELLEKYNINIFEKVDI